MVPGPCPKRGLDLDSLFCASLVVGACLGVTALRPSTEVGEAFRRTPSPRLDEELPQVLPCFRLMLPDGALFTEDGVPIPVVIVADLRAMADWLPTEAKRINGISSVGLALDGTRATSPAIPPSRSANASPPWRT
jgi:hypothetical protein